MFFPSPINTKADSVDPVGSGAEITQGMQHDGAGEVVDRRAASLQGLLKGPACGRGVEAW